MNKKHIHEFSRSLHSIIEEMVRTRLEEQRLDYYDNKVRVEEINQIETALTYLFYGLEQ